MHLILVQLSHVNYIKKIKLQINVSNFVC